MQGRPRRERRCYRICSGAGGASTRRFAGRSANAAHTSSRNRASEIRDLASAPESRSRPVARSRLAPAARPGRRPTGSPGQRSAPADRRSADCPEAVCGHPVDSVALQANRSAAVESPIRQRRPHVVPESRKRDPGPRKRARIPITTRREIPARACGASGTTANRQPGSAKRTRRPAIGGLPGGGLRPPGRLGCLASEPIGRRRVAHSPTPPTRRPGIAQARSGTSKAHPNPHRDPSRGPGSRLRRVRDDGQPAARVSEAHPQTGDRRIARMRPCSGCSVDA